MNPDKKYMSQASLDDNDIKFVPPAFIYKSPRREFSSDEGNRNLDLFPSKTGFPELCHYSEEKDDSLSGEFGINIADNSVPTTFDVLRNLDLDLDEKEDLERANSDNDVNKIYLKIEQKHPGIFATLYSYRIPRPIVRVIIKKLIGLTLHYCDKK
ncbi:hypothetical protein [Clostridium sp.]|uniref:hypothetical protein n=1 Tax=Clostridium sp. TaxID=1506 RepID=UPI00284D10A4|nr:hypothetical protein [Clostridium sp.]MDR3596271.1 hypothetical protein [Clostridium sp.]